MATMMPQQTSDGLTKDNRNNDYVSMDVESSNTNPNTTTANNDDDHTVDSSSVLTADGISDPSGFAVVCLVILIGDMSRGIMFPSLWALVNQLVEADNQAAQIQGLCVGAFSFGRILSTPYFGKWSVQVGYSLPLVVSTSILLLGTILYAQTPLVGHASYLILAQTVLGLGSGSLGVTRAYCASITPQRHRTAYMGWITAVQYGGFTVTPVLGSLFNTILSKDKNRWLTMYTAPAYFMSVLCVITLICLRIWFRHRERVDTAKTVVTKKSTRRQALEQVANTITWTGLSIYDWTILSCMLLNVSTKGSIASLETMGMALAGTHFGLEYARAGSIVGACGALGVFCLLHMRRLGEMFSDIQLVCGGMLLMTVGVGILQTAAVNDDDATTNPIIYVISMLCMYGVGYPVGHTAVMGLFSKIVGRRPQGELQGYFASFGSLARIVVPALTGCLLESHLSVLLLILVVALSVSIVGVAWKRDTLTLLST